jgi:hypothetical protein
MGYHERRGIGRESQLIAATLELGSEYLPVEIRNLSSEGAMLDGVHSLPAGEHVSVEIPDIGWVEARIAWSVEPRCGLVFDTPIDLNCACA